MTYRIDNLQYCNWSEEIFKINNEAGLNAIHVTIAYHEDFDEVKNNVEQWDSYFEEFNNLIYDITNFLVYVADPSANERKRIGVYVLLFLLLFTSFAYLTYREFKKELK